MVAAGLSRRRLRHLPLAWLARYGQNRRMATPTKHSGATPRLGVPAQPSPRRILEDGTYRPTILDLPGGERPRERMRDIGASALSNGELLAILLRTGTPAENILELAARILTRFDGLAGLARAGHAGLCELYGFGKAKAAQLLAAEELGRRVQLAAHPERPIISSPQGVADLVSGDMVDFEKEHLECCCSTPRTTCLLRLTFLSGA